MESPDTAGDYGIRGELVAAVRAAIRLVEPFLNAMIAKDVLALRQAQRGLYNTLWARLAEIVIADNTCCGASRLAQEATRGR